MHSVGLSIWQLFGGLQRLVYNGEALRKITGKDFGQDADKWQKWWKENKEDVTGVLELKASPVTGIAKLTDGRWLLFLRTTRFSF